MGELVLKKIERSGRLNIHKLSEKFAGPYKVRKVHVNKVAYELEDPDGTIIRAHFSQLRPYRTPPKYLEDFMILDLGDTSEDTSEDISEDSEEDSYGGFGIPGGIYVGSEDSSSSEESTHDLEKSRVNKNRSRRDNRRNLSEDTESFDSEDEELKEILIQIEKEEEEECRIRETERRRRKSHDVTLTDSEPDNSKPDRTMKNKNIKIEKSVHTGRSDKQVPVTHDSIINEGNKDRKKVVFKTEIVPSVDEDPENQYESTFSNFGSPLERDQQTWLEGAEDWNFSDDGKEGSVKSLDLTRKTEINNELRARSKSLSNILEVLNSLGRAATELSNSMEGILSEGSNEGDRITETCEAQLTSKLVQVTARLEGFRRTQELWRRREREDIIRRRRVEGDPDFIGWSATPLNSSLYEIEETEETIEPEDHEEYIPEPWLARSVVTDPNLRPRTRAQGRVLDLPNVQDHTLERKKKRPNND